MPRRADGVWVDAKGAPLYYTDPNDPKWRTNPEMEFRDGRWVNKATGTPSLMRDDFPRETTPGSKQWQWPDGTPVEDKDLAEISHQAAGNPPTPGATDYGAHGSYDLTGALDALLPSDAPGAELDTSRPDESRERMQAYLEALTGQAQTGGGAWEQALRASTGQASDSAMALGQSTPGVESMAAMRGIQNAQAGVRQRAAGTAEELRQKTKQAAQTELDATLAAQGSTDAAQAAQEAAARQARRQANEAIYEQARKQNEGILSGVAQAGAAIAASNGGAVPGVPEAPGDSPDNDTVPAWLSPGEVVLPRSVVAQGPDAAADFVRAVQAQHRGAPHFDGGGMVPGAGFFSPGNKPAPTPAPAPRPAPAPSSGAPVIGGTIPLGSLSPGPRPAPPSPSPSTSTSSDPTARGQTSGLFGFGAPQIAVDVEHGGLLDTAAYDATRAQGQQAADAFLRAYQGQGPSLAPQQFRSGMDDTLAAAMAAQAGTKGAGRAASVGNVQSAAGREFAGDAGRAGATTAQESMAGGRSFAEATQRQRQQDLALAMAQQQAAWKNSMLNAGIGLQAQTQVLGLLGGAGQALAGFSDLLSERGDAADFGGDGADDDGEGIDWDWDDADAAADGGVVTTDGVDAPPGFVGTIQPGETPEEAAARLGGIYRDVAAERAQAQAGAQSRADEAMFGRRMAAQLAPPRPVAAPPDPLVGGMSEGPPGELVSRPQELVSRMPDQRPINARTAPDSAPDSATKPAVQTQGGVAPRAKPATSKEDFIGQERRAALEMGNIQADAARQTADAQAAYVDQVQRHQLEAAERQVRARQQADSDFAAIQQARDELKSISATVDPGRWWASRSTPGKVAAAIGLALGAVGAGRDGVNRAVGIIEGAIGRDLEAQKAEHELKLRKGQLDVNAATSLYGIHRQMAQDDLAAADSSRASAYELAKAQVDLIAAKTGSPMAKQQALLLSAQLGQKAQQLDDAAKQRAFENYLKVEDMKTRRMAAMSQQAEREKPADYGHDFAAPGYHVIPGAKPSADELKRWRDGLAEKHNADVAITKLKNLIDESWMLPGQEATARAQSLIADLKVGYKNMAALGALSGSDYALLEAEIPDPTSFKGHLVDDKTLKSRLDQFVESAEMKFRNRAKVLGIEKDDTAPAQSRRIAQNQKTGEMRYIEADGSLGEVVR